MLFRCPVFVAKEHIRLEQSGEVFSKPVKACEPLGGVRHPPHPAGKVGQAGDLGLPVRPYPFAEQLRQGEDGLSFPEKVRAGAAGSLAPVNFQLLHAVGDEGKAPFSQVGVLQQPGGYRLCQALVAEQIQLVPAAALPPLLLVAFGGGLRNSFSPWSVS